MFFGSGSTVFRAINVAIIKGARTISLHGLDLDNRYISQIETEHDYDNGQVNEVHLTESPLKKIRASFYLKTLLELKKDNIITCDINYLGNNEKLKLLFKEYGHA